MDQGAWVEGAKLKAKPRSHRLREVTRLGLRGFRVVTQMRKRVLRVGPFPVPAEVALPAPRCLLGAWLWVMELGGAVILVG